MQTIVTLTRKVTDVNEAVELIHAVREDFGGSEYAAKMPELNWGISSNFKPELENIQTAEAALGSMLESAKEAVSLVYYTDGDSEVRGFAKVGVASENGNAVAMLVDLDEEDGELTVTVFANCTRGFLSNFAMVPLYRLGFDRNDFSAYEVQPVVYTSDCPAGMKWYEDKGMYMARRYTEYNDAFDKAAIELEAQAEIIRWGYHYGEHNSSELAKVAMGERVLLEGCQQWVSVFVNELLRRDAEAAKAFAGKTIDMLAQTAKLY